jgi:hypothetical protein
MEAVMAIALIFIIVGMFYSGFARGYKVGHQDTLEVYTKHMLEVRQRISASAWEEVNSAYRIMYERQQRELNNKNVEKS